MESLFKYIASARTRNWKLPGKKRKPGRHCPKAVNVSSVEVNMFKLGGCLVLSVLALALSAPAEVGEKQAERIANRPRVSGMLRLHLRERHEEPRGSGKFKVVERVIDWEVAE